MRLTISPPSCAECHEIWEPKPPGTLWATPGLLQDCLFKRPLGRHWICSCRLVHYVKQIKTKGLFSGSGFTFKTSFELLETAKQTVSSPANLHTGDKQFEISERTNA